MNRINAVLLVLWWCSSCTPGGVDDPPTTTTIAPPSTTTTSPEPPPPTDGPVPGDYIKIVRAPVILKGQSSGNIGLIAGAQALSFAGWRDPLRVLTRCPWAFDGDEPYLGMSRERANSFAAEGAALTRKAEDNFIPRFTAAEPNKRCDAAHEQHHPDFCERLDIRKSVYGPFGALGDIDTPRGLFWFHLDRANVMRNRAGRCRSTIRSAGGKAYDSIAGWCTAMNGLGWRSEDCP